MISDTFIFHVRKILKINIISINQWDCLERYLHQQYWFLKNIGYHISDIRLIFFNYVILNIKDNNNVISKFQKHCKESKLYNQLMKQALKIRLSVSDWNLWKW